MLQLKPKLRPSVQKILGSNLLERKRREFMLEVETKVSPFKEQLLRTIKIPRNLHYLTDQLPKPNYEELHNYVYTTNNSPEPVKKEVMRSLEKINVSLPKLVHILKLSKNSNEEKKNNKNIKRNKKYKN
jgi:NIMA (never in mitosis gene a)-related kinase